MKRHAHLGSVFVVFAIAIAATLAVTQGHSSSQGHVRQAVGEPGEAQEALVANDRLARLSASTLAVKPGAQAAAIAQRAKIAASGRSIYGTSSAWKPYGTGPMVGDGGQYSRVATQGMGDLAGRVNHFAYDAATGRLFASVGQGGVWALDKGSTTWRSLGDKLPTQAVGGIGYTKGILIVLTGNDVFGGGTTFTGVGAYYSTNMGGGWTKATGIPNGVNAFQVAVDPSNANVVYAATGAGLFRSTDAGKSYTNVKLPVSPAGSVPNCTGALPTVEGCYLANMVTDVIVRAPGGVGSNKQGGAVVAAVGWRAGNKKNTSAKYPGGYVESPGNGIYTSTTGVPGSFAKVNDPFNEASGPTGRIELGNATGPAQDHNYLYAVVGDATPLQGGSELAGIDIPTGGTGAPSKSTTYLKGIYSSADFGQTWQLMTNATALMAPETGSSLIGYSCAAGSYCPGVQAWYNAWIEPDPTRTDSSGVPSRLVFGLEEIWENRLADQGVGASGPTEFKTIGSYTGGTSCVGLILSFPGCPTASGFGSITTHPDHHDGLFVPDGSGGVTLYDGNDGGVFAQHVDSVQPLSNANWGRGLNNGFNTFMPYQAVMAKDGTLYAGLQDNGELRTEASGAEFNTHDGDGTWSAVDPDDSNVVYERQPGGALQKSSDGGKNWSATTAPSDTFQFVNPFVMDPTDSSHLLDAGNKVWETKDGGGSWTSLFTLGTSPAGVAYAMSAIDLRSERFGDPLPTGPHTPDFTYTDGATTVPAGTTGTVDVPGTYVDHAFTIKPTEGDARVNVKITWANALYDWDLYLYRNDGGTLVLVDHSGSFNTQTGVAEEYVSVANPQAGDYIVRVVNSTAQGTFNGAVSFVQRTAIIPSQTRNVAYVGFCGTCDALNARPFDSGIATSVGTQGWHRAAAIGLPKRFITSVKSDPTNASTVYVTLAGYSRRWMVPGLMGEGGNFGTGNVFKSTDAGEHFTNISGNLPDGPAESTVVYGGNLIVGTDTGVYISKGTSGGTYSLLGTGLPNAPVFTMGLKPKATSTEASLLYVATHGRGMYAYTLPKA
jgi:Bacterial pre-peptidase C-terminal domain